jgi:YVTN family beta-propeller protein
VCNQFQDWPGRTKDGVVQVIDTATWTVTHTIPVGNNPHNIWFSGNGDEAVVTNWFDVTLSRIDANAKTVLATCPAGPSPAHVTSDDAGLYYYVTMEGSTYVHRFTQAGGGHGICESPGMLNPEAAWVNGYMPHGIWYANGKVVTSNSMESTFSIIDAATLTETAMLPTGAYPLGAAANSIGTLGASGNMIGKSVSVFDLVDPAQIRDIPVPGAAVQTPFSPDDANIVAANGSYVTVIDAAKAADPVNYPDPATTIVASLWTGDGAHGVAFGPKSGGGTYAYVTHKFENYVTVIDLGTMTVAGAVPLVTSTTGKTSLAGSTDTGGQGIAYRPVPPPLK